VAAPGGPAMPGVPVGRQVAAAPMQATPSVFAWGQDSSGELGDGGGADQARPVAVTGVPAGARQVVVSQGGLEGGWAAALLANGTVDTWGDNSFGQLGDDTTNSFPGVITVGGLTGVTQISAGADTMLALDSSGSVWSWGFNDEGELGNGTSGDNTNTDVPHKVPGLTGVTQIAAGEDDSFAVRSDGTLWGWGFNGSGELGDLTTTERTSPQQVPGLPKVTQVAAGVDSTIAIAGSNNTVWAWGDDRDGEVGDGTAAGFVTGVRQLSLNGATQVSMGGEESSAVLSNGALYTWGDNAHGSLGTGSTANNQTAPAQVTDLIGVTQAAVDGEVGVAIGRSDFGPVPDVTEDNVKVAEAALQAAGFTVGAVTTFVDNTCNNINTVRSERPAAGTIEQFGTAVGLSVGAKPSRPCP
jgi:alpha-tubulin suppressor-like RCC1 family protein